MPTPLSDRAARADHAACAASLRQGSRSFSLAARLMPSQGRRHAVALYGFCRMADDLIDGSDSATLPAALESLRLRLDGVYAGCPASSPIDRAFAATVAACAIPRALPEALLEGFAWDAAARRYADIGALRCYAARVAGAVGVMMALIMGVRDPAALARAGDLGVAMQLSNIARDVGEDAAMGRLYLPREWLVESGIAPDAWLEAPVFSPGLEAVVGRVLAEAELLYARADGGIALLPAPYRPAMRAAARLYREIGREVARAGHDSMRARAVVRPGRKALVLLGSLVPMAAGQSRPALAETQFLIDCVPREVIRPAANPLVRVLELFASLEQRDLMRHTG